MNSLFEFSEHSCCQHAFIVLEDLNSVSTQGLTSMWAPSGLKVGYLGTGADLGWKWANPMIPDDSNGLCGGHIYGAQEGWKWTNAGWVYVRGAVQTKFELNFVYQG